MAKRIMVIDDSKEILELIEMILSEEGYEVALYSFGLHDLVEVKRVTPDLIILDYLIGQEEDGWNLLQKLKLDRETATIPVIICSAAAKQLREMASWLNEKGVGVVYKPFDIDDLLLAVHKMLEGTPAVINQVVKPAPENSDSHPRRVPHADTH
jgi:DNA-binding response OmpR family regulator